MRGALLRAGRQALAARAAVAVQGASTGRLFATEASSSGGGSNTGLLVFGGLGLAGGLIFAQQQGYLSGLFQKESHIPLPPKKDYDKVRAAIEDALDKDDYDDGSYGPVLVRLAWHASGSYDKASNTGGSNGATMRFDPERKFGANAGLEVARDLLEPIKKKFDWITYADLWTLAGAVAIEAMGGPTIPWRPGRSDKLENEGCPPDGRLPDGDKGAPHLRDIFYRMGFNDQEIVALSGAHALGRCHADRSGWINPWTNAPTTFSNAYFTELRDNKWTKKKWSGPPQYEDPTGTLMMLPTDMVLIWDKKFKPYVMKYAQDEESFFKDFAAAFSRLLELGVPFDEPGKPAPA
ncbi:hypothetical protein WJX73_007395 [Symbiochloris irregularis]|uniref:Cytochrome c peroxidase, mitochondrial n=1 Tax=Symbiochloris irregularis TaxID=706552 RepID=A0AAW1PK08_9CHLO